ncbi:MAG: isoprenylcysteine carboxylmethyltransferase family protein [Armatimonadota bacterium]
MAKSVAVLIPRTRKEIWLNRVRTWLPPVFVIVAIALTKPAWSLWGIPLVVLGEALRTWAAGHLVKDERLTTGGPYAHVRNPLYLGSLLSTVGFLLVLGDWLLAAIFLALALAIYLPTVKQEEDYLRRMHGEAFDTYRKAVPGIIPRLTPAKLATMGQPPSGAGFQPAQAAQPPHLGQDLRVLPQAAEVPSRFSWRRVVENTEHRTWVALVALFLLLWLRGKL